MSHQKVESKDLDEIKNHMIKNDESSIFTPGVISYVINETLLSKTFLYEPLALFEALYEALSIMTI